MTLARKGTRVISLDGVRYRWQVRWKSTYLQGPDWEPLRFVVEHIEGRGALLIVELPVPYPGNWLDLPTAPVTPSLVASSIRSALAEGWLPQQQGPPYRINADLSHVRW